MDCGWLGLLTLQTFWVQQSHLLIDEEQRLQMCDQPILCNISPILSTCHCTNIHNIQHYIDVYKVDWGIHAVHVLVKFIWTAIHMENHPYAYFWASHHYTTTYQIINLINFMEIFNCLNFNFWNHNCQFFFAENILCREAKCLT